jgi:hypothetical protein
LLANLLNQCRIKTKGEIMAGEDISREDFRVKAVRDLGLDTPIVERVVPTPFEKGLAAARIIMASGNTQVAVAASGMDSETLVKLQEAFDPKDIA